jgi:probable phosphomutase (TIGR03848 family)
VTLLLLIRHGVTEATGVRLLGWTPGISLSPSGREQADAIASRLEAIPIAGIYSSPLDRCRETAAPLAVARGRDVVVREELGEVRYGSWTNRPLRQLARTKLWRRVQAVPSGVRFPGGESLLEVQARAIRGLEQICGEHPRRAVAVFSHADVIKLLVAHYAGAPMDLFQRLAIDPASISAIGVGDGVPRILLVNDSGSLADLAPAKGRRSNVGG